VATFCFSFLLIRGFVVELTSYVFPLFFYRAEEAVLMPCYNLGTNVYLIPLHVDISVIRKVVN
jgi:hypothetical protein